MKVFKANLRNRGTVDIELSKLDLEHMHRICEFYVLNSIDNPISSQLASNVAKELENLI